MNIIGWDFYLVSRLDEIKVFLVVLAFVFTLSFVTMMIANPEEFDRRSKRRLIVLAAMSWFLFLAIPTTKEMAEIVKPPEQSRNQKINKSQSDELDRLTEEWLSELDQKFNQTNKLDILVK